MKKIKIRDYTYTLPVEKIAKYPLSDRSNSKLLHFKNNKINEYSFKDISNLLNENTLLVRNNTKVIYARLKFFKPTGSAIEIFCLNPHNPTDYDLSFSAHNKCSWKCIVGNQKKWKQNEIYLKKTINNKPVEIIARKIQKLETEYIIEFEWNLNISFAELLDTIGEIPIPPYLNRDAENSDKNTYQTVYSQIAGSVAAPTAGLHFTNNIFKQLENKNIKTTEITLHVGAGTFKPVKSETIGMHEMHTEFFIIKKSVLELIISKLGNITAIGTTSIRTLESLYRMGVKKIQQKKDFNFISQWEIYENSNIPVQQALEALLPTFDNNNELKAYTQILIAPGYEFKLTDALITNFHQPNSTLLLLVAAFVGHDWQNIYNFALNNNFRFLSYGDSSLLIK